MSVGVVHRHFGSSVSWPRSAGRPVFLAMSGRWDEDTGEYTPSNAEVAEGMRRWEIPPDGDWKVFHWLKVQERQKYHDHQLGGWPLHPLELVAPPSGYAPRECPERGATSSRGRSGHPPGWW